MAAASCISAGERAALLNWRMSPPSEAASPRLGASSDPAATARRSASSTAIRSPIGSIRRKGEPHSRQSMSINCGKVIEPMAHHTTLAAEALEFLLDFAGGGKDGETRIHRGGIEYSGSASWGTAGNGRRVKVNQQGHVDSGCGTACTRMASACPAMTRIGACLTLRRRKSSNGSEGAVVRWPEARDQCGHGAQG